MTARLIPELLASFYFHSPLFPDLFAPDEPVWRCLDKIASFLREASESSGVKAFIHPSAIVIDSYIGKGCRIWEGATVRHSIIGDDTEIGHACEVARSIVLRNVAISHFNFVGDSVIGDNVCVGASTVLANLRLDDALVSVEIKGRPFVSGRRRLGAVIGDDCHLGTGCVVNPGALIGPRSVVMPSTAVTGFIPPESVVGAKHDISISPLDGKNQVR